MRSIELTFSARRVEVLTVWVGILAAWWPGWRASKLDILRAVTAE